MLRKISRNLEYLAGIAVSIKVIDSCLSAKTKRQIKFKTGQLKNKVVYKFKRATNKW